MRYRSSLLAANMINFWLCLLTYSSLFQPSFGRGKKKWVEFIYSEVGGTAGISCFLMQFRLHTQILI